MSAVQVHAKIYGGQVMDRMLFSGNAFAFEHTSITDGSVCKPYIELAFYDMLHRKAPGPPHSHTTFGLGSQLPEIPLLRMSKPQEYSKNGGADLPSEAGAFFIAVDCPFSICVKNRMRMMIAISLDPAGEESQFVEYP